MKWKFGRSSHHLPIRNRRNRMEDGRSSHHLPIINRVEDWKIFPSSSHQKSNGRLEDLPIFPSPLLQLLLAVAVVVFFYVYAPILLSVLSAWRSLHNCSLTCGLSGFPFQRCWKAPQNVFMVSRFRFYGFTQNRILRSTLLFLGRWWSSGLLLLLRFYRSPKTQFLGGRWSSWLLLFDSTL